MGVLGAHARETHRGLKAHAPLGLGQELSQRSGRIWPADPAEGRDRFISRWSALVLREANEVRDGCHRCRSPERRDDRRASLFFGHERGQHRPHRAICIHKPALNIPV